MSRFGEQEVMDTDAFVAVFDAHFPALHGYLRRRLGEPLAEELAAETFARAFDARATYDPARATVLPWLHGIAANLISGHYRSEARRHRAYARAASQVEQTTPAATGDRVDAHTAAAALSGAIADLRPEERDVLLLYAWADLSYEEIAAALNVPVGTVRSRLHRGRERLRAALTEGGSDD
jgi:RNA polymerase sigma factor (sigma-70 family)